jgi:DNA helicase-2/ATP-dependent DNA helicase PcrA
VSIAIGKMLDRTGYLKDLRDENSEEANERIENLMELVSAAREYETREPEPSLGGFVDRCRCCRRRTRSPARERAGLDDDDARGQGARVPVVVIAGLEEGCSRTRDRRGRDELEEERRLCYVGMTRAQRSCPDRRARGAVFGEYQSTEPSRFLDESPASCRAHHAGVPSAVPGTSRTRTTSSARIRTAARAAARFKETRGSYSYENEDQSATACGRACASGTRSSASAR